VRYRLRDQQGAARSVAYLLLAGGPVSFVTGIVLVPGQRHPGPIAGFTTLAVALTLGGVVCRWRPDRVPQMFWSVVPFLAVLLISGLNVATHDASTGSQLFYLWPVLYAASFLRRTAMISILFLVGLGHAAVVFPILGGTQGALDWVSLTVALTLTAVVVASLRIRNDRLREVLQTQALADPLTGVANRRSFDGELIRAVAEGHRGGRPVALLTLDIDHFKQINDSWGHAVGDQALQQVAAALCAVARRDEDVVARLGGDEFVVLLRTDQAGAGRAADEIRSAVADGASLPGGPPGLSIGIALLPDHAVTGAELVAASDGALYAAKSAGRGRTAVADLVTLDA